MHYKSDICGMWDEHMTIYCSNDVISRNKQRPHIYFVTIWVGEGGYELYARNRVLLYVLSYQCRHNKNARSPGGQFSSVIMIQLLY